MPASLALQKLCKWRSFFAGWQLGTRPIEEPGVRAVRDVSDRLLILRVEMTAMTALLIKKGIITAQEFEAEIDREATMLDRDYERDFGGFRTTQQGLLIYDQDLATQTMKRLGFPM
jgi:hypothetical protein